MKGISHFISGVAGASCFPWAVAAALEGQAFYFVLGAIFGILPDTIDFKFYRFFYHYHGIITPNPRKFDPQVMADQIADAVEASLGSPALFRLKIDTIQVSSDEWRQFKICFDSKQQAVEVELGPVVSTGQVPVSGTFPESGTPKGWRKLAVPFNETYEAVTTVDIFDGPSFGFEHHDDGSMIIHFLPWHRSWTHSFVVGALLSIPVALWLGWRAGVVSFCAYALHIMEDQLGFMGSNLFAPFTRKRVRGLHWMRSGDALPNFGTVWICCLIIFWNCYSVIDTPLYHFGFGRLLLYGGVMPFGVFGLLYFLLTPSSVAFFRNR